MGEADARGGEAPSAATPFMVDSGDTGDQGAAQLDAAVTDIPISARLLHTQHPHQNYQVLDSLKGM